MQVTFIEEPAPAPYITPTGGLKQPLGRTILPTTLASGIDVPAGGVSPAVELVVPGLPTSTSSSGTGVGRTEPVSAQGGVPGGEVSALGGVPRGTPAGGVPSGGGKEQQALDFATAHDDSTDDDDDDSDDDSVVSSYGRATASKTAINKGKAKVVRPSTHIMRTRQHANGIQSSELNDTDDRVVFDTDQLPGLTERQYYALLAAAQNITADPTTYRKAMMSSNEEHWRRAMDAEMASLRANDTADLVEYDPKMDVISGKWVYATKRRADGTIIRYKASFVCRGLEQKYGVNFELVFAPVGKHTTLRVLLAYAAKYNYPTKQMDVKTAFLQSPVDEVIYVSQPQGYEQRGANGELLVMKLKKSLYGLKQAPRNWHKTFEAFLLSIGFTKSTADPCLFVRTDGTLLLLYVDDLAIVAKTEEKLETLSQQLQSHFSMTDEGMLALYLGMQVIRDPITGDIELTQSHYIQTLLERLRWLTVTVLLHQLSLVCCLLLLLLLMTLY
jgi:Reverse transcriptase (RNA-dependent DNA polymerase)